jgi:hypothetical protein
MNQLKSLEISLQEKLSQIQDSKSKPEPAISTDFSLSMHFPISSIFGIGKN